MSPRCPAIIVRRRVGAWPCASRLELAEQAVGGVNAQMPGGQPRGQPGSCARLRSAPAPAWPQSRRPGSPGSRGRRGPRGRRRPASISLVASSQGHLGQQQLGGARPVRGCRPGISTFLGWRAGAPRRPGTALGAVVAGEPDTAAETGRPVEALEGGVAGQRTLDQLFQVEARERTAARWRRPAPVRYASSRESGRASGGLSPMVRQASGCRIGGVWIEQRFVQPVARSRGPRRRSPVRGGAAGLRLPWVAQSSLTKEANVRT